MTRSVLSIIIPVYNEEITISKILERVKSVVLINSCEKEIIIVNDFSNDSTEDEVKKFREKNPELAIQYLQHQKNRGKGASIRTGIKSASGNFSIIQDADLEYDPEEINKTAKTCFRWGS